MRGDPATPLAAAIAERIRRAGPIGYAELIEAALYDPEHGFYETGGHAGRRGDFLTSPEVGPLFGTVVAQALAAWWDELGRPDAFTVVEVGAGPGTLARAVLAAPGGPWRDALRYVTVERSALQRSRHPAEVESRATMPDAPRTGVVIANELFDNLPFDLVEARDGAWRSVLIDVDATGALVERLGELADPPAPIDAEGLVPGARLPVQQAAQQFVRESLGLLDRGVVVVIDYAARAADLARRPWTEWVRTYREHQPGGHPLEHLGRQDITCEVLLDPIVAAAPAELTTQAAFLAAHGIDELVAHGRAAWHHGAARGDLAALRGRSRVREAEALCDPAGLGGFTVIRWLR